MTYRRIEGVIPSINPEYVSWQTWSPAGSHVCSLITKSTRSDVLDQVTHLNLEVYGDWDLSEVYRRLEAE